MAPSTEFKKALRQGKLGEALVIAMGNSPKLKITTWISSPDDNSPEATKKKSITTQVNLLEGKISNAIGEDLIADALYSAVQKFHSQQVTQGHQAISQNIQSLQQMFRLMSIWQKQQNGTEFQSIKLLESIPKISASPFTIEPTPIIAPTGHQEIDLASKGLTQGIEPEDELEADKLTDALMSIVDLEIEEEKITQVVNDENEDWGEWLDDDDSNLEQDILNLESVDLDKAKDWEERDGTYSNS